MMKIIRTKGFTLLEILVVLVLLAILTVSFMPNFLKFESAFDTNEELKKSLLTQILNPSIRPEIHEVIISSECKKISVWAGGAISTNKCE